MPRYVRKKTTKRRAYKPKSKVPRPIFKTNVNVGRGLPKKMTMIHKFNERAYIQALGGTPSAIGTVEYYANNMFRVNKTTGSSHQPLYFDQMAAIYNTFTVIGSKIKITFISQGGGSSAIAGVFLNDKVAAVVPLLASTMVEQTGSKNGLVPGAFNPGLVRTYTWSAKKRVGGSILGNPDLSGSDIASPLETNTFVLFMQSFDKLSTVRVDYMVEIEYIAVWSGLRDVSGS